MKRAKRWPKDRKLTEEEKSRILRAIPSHRGEEFKTFHDSGLSLSAYIAKKTRIPERRVAGVIARCTRDWHEDNAEMRELIQDLLRKDPPPEGVGRSEWVSRQIGIRKDRAAAFIAGLSKTENRLLIIDATFESREGKSEGKHLKELFRIYDSSGVAKSNPVTATSQEKFLEILEKATEKYIHVSAHGAHLDEGTCIAPSVDSTRALIYPENIERIETLWKEKKKPRLVVMTACEAGHGDLARAFARAGCMYFIAPRHRASWIEATLFNTLFYYYLFVRGKLEHDAYEEAIRRIPDLERVWAFYENGKMKLYSN